MKTFKLVISLIFMLHLTTLDSYTQEVTYNNLKGFEDYSSNSQLYYVKRHTTPCDNGIELVRESNIYHFDTSNSSDSLRFSGTSRQNNYENCYNIGYKDLTDFHIGKADSNFVVNFKSGTHKYSSNEIYGSLRMLDPGLLINFIRHPYLLDKFLIEYLSYSAGEGNKTNELFFNYEDDENPADTLYFSSSLGYRFLEPSIQRSDSTIFILESDSLFFTNDLNKSKSLSLPSVIDFIDSSNDSLSIYGDSHLNIYHTRSSDLIYWFVDLKDSQSDSVHTYLLKNSLNGEIDNWEASPLFSKTENDLNTSYYAVSSDSVLFASEGTKLFKSVNAGNSFESLITFDHTITGLYAKPDSDILYVLTKKALFKIENGQPTSIKQVPVSNEESPEIPNAVSLKQNYPNPFNPTTTIEFELDRSTFTKLTVFDVLGRKVRELVNEIRPAGTNTIEFNANNLASGVYLYRLEANGVVQTKRLTLIK
ncbi:MAG: T9SS type A sorting domain-containing protein [Balneola sp.]